MLNLYKKSIRSNGVRVENEDSKRRNEKKSTVVMSGVKRHENLIKKLEDDHRVLMSLVSEIKRDSEAGKWRVVEQGLEEFQSLMTDHLLTETIQLYALLRQKNRHDEEAFSIIVKFSAEMAVISKAVKLLLDNYQNVSVVVSAQHAFDGDWKALRKVLEHRMQREEKDLFPLY